MIYNIKLKLNGNVEKEGIIQELKILFEKNNLLLSDCKLEEYTEQENDEVELLRKEIDRIASNSINGHLLTYHPSTTLNITPF